MENRGPGAETMLLLVGIVLLVLLCYSILPSLTPFALIGAIVFLLYPVRRNPVARRILWLSLLLFAVWMIGSLMGVLTPFIISFLLAYIFDPLVEYLAQRKVPRWASSLLIIAVILASIAVLLLTMIPVLSTQSKTILEGINGLIRGGVEYIRGGRLTEFLVRLGVPPDQLHDFIANKLPARLEGMLVSVLNGLLGFLTSISFLVSQILNLVIIPFVTFYLLKDYPYILQHAQTLLPAGRPRESVTEYFSRVDEVLGRYLRGTLLVALIQGVLTASGLLLLGIPYALLLGLMTGILNLIPYAGFYSSLVFAVIASLFGGGAGTGTRIISVVLLYIGLNLLETTVWSPKIVGRHVGLHPVALIIALVVFGYFIGFVGLLIAVPVTAILSMTFTLWRQRSLAPPVPAGMGSGGLPPSSPGAP